MYVYVCMYVCMYINRYKPYHIYILCALKTYENVLYYSPLFSYAIRSLQLDVAIKTRALIAASSCNRSSCRIPG